jgi:hypothetical protein
LKLKTEHPCGFTPDITCLVVSELAGAWMGGTGGTVTERGNVVDLGRLSHKGHHAIVGPRDETQTATYRGLSVQTAVVQERSAILIPVSAPTFLRRGSAVPMPAEINTAPSALPGWYRSGPVKNRSTNAIATAATSP